MRYPFYIYQILKKINKSNYTKYCQGVEKKETLTYNLWAETGTVILESNLAVLRGITYVYIL